MQNSRDQGKRMAAIIGGNQYASYKMSDEPKRICYAEFIERGNRKRCTFAVVPAKCPLIYNVHKAHHSSCPVEAKNIFDVTGLPKGVFYNIKKNKQFEVVQCHGVSGEQDTQVEAIPKAAVHPDWI